MSLLSTACNLTRRTAARHGLSPKEKHRLSDIFTLVREFQTSAPACGQKPTFKTILNDPLVHIPPRISVSQADLFCDPTEKLQKLLQTPLFDENERPYRPLVDEMKLAQTVFTSERPRDIRRVESTIRIEKAPIYNLPEVAFLGRSNVGKSSMISCLFHKAPFVKVPVSSTPGFTKTLKFYQVKDYFTLVDMPGYGFNQPHYFRDCVENFLRHRQNLVRTFLMFDMASSVGLEDCRIMEEFKLPYAIMLNKIDLVKDSQRLEVVGQVRTIRDKFGSPNCYPQPFLIR
ncbi:hypothetical protein RvY_09036-2 [Ramazzottius varieornatus]|uniref:EngB-type G domain-containing protein n=1 Tax=Ramazzottius varieornatus TaxID=947166 RepID=A0A1D1VAE9_RAMVA|nr:hypothetical protein RvY_09036-2 [Ramazzottius varieornatus]